MKILQVNNTMNIGGIESFIMNVYRKIDKEKYEFIFLTYNNEKYYFEDEILELGGSILRISNPNKVSIFRHVKELYNAIKESKADVVHCHTHFNCAYVLLAAKLAKVPIRISHSHSTYALLEKNPLKKIKRAIARVLINNLSTERFACSQEAGKALYKRKDFIVIPNGIDISKYKYNEEARKKLRKELNIDKNELVIGHVGRISKVKNHSFLIDVFSRLLKLNQNCKLVLIGDGEKNLVDELKKQITKLNIEDKVIFLGNRNDTYNLLNALDIFVFPSIYEGIPLALIEAQCNGLPIIASDIISKEVKITDCLFFYSLEKKEEEWADFIYKHKDNKRIDTLKEVSKSNYSIEKAIDILKKYYK